MGMISTKLRKSARGQECMFRIPGVCNHNQETTVLCHAPSEAKGLGNKSHDFHASFGCSECHQVLDLHRLSREEELFFWLRGMQRTQRYWIDAGLIVVPADLKASGAPKTRPKKTTAWPSKTIQSRPFPDKAARAAARQQP